MKSSLQTFFISAVLSLLVFITNSFAQTAPLQYYIQSYHLESGVFDGNGSPENNPVEVFSSIIELHSVPWIQLHFSDSNLGDGSYIIIKSVYDGLWQKLNSVSLEQWNNFSAYFNGNAVEIKLFLAPSDKQVFIHIDEIIVGEWYEGELPLSICGSTDDRELSNQQATGRLLSPGCTGWIIPNGKIVSAGHCLTSATGSTVLQFNVPPSLPNGTVQHPGPEDQYSVNVSTRIFVNGGIGDDWGVIEAYPNSVTNLLPIQAQGTYWPLAQNYSPDSIRITGYGTATGVRNQVQQTHVGPNAGSSGTTMRYRTDTTGGNSGSPVIDALTNVAVGVHTHGGCTSSGGNNNGTSFFSTAFWDAVEQGIPVELISFRASVFEGAVELNWMTATETNNSGFEIQRSSGGDFETIDFVDGNGTTTEPNSYSYIDRDVPVGTFTYRLKQIDFDGSFEYSQIVEVTIPAPVAFALDQNYPNPFNPSTRIKFAIPEESDVRMSVYNTLGQEVAEILSGRLREGFHEVEFDAGSLTSGIYFYRLEAEKFVDVKKMIIIK
ncbi:MAG: T9SS type A sorting domain-containing protein [Ignavibacteriaceae bacterium]|nr:T9SS type A sorting domain-containing protein [Ignavibacteriaceae bacterium]MCU0365438.1 T9SS type A sorting domain-containing protein [Ignavibacteriaceae bacterium]